MIRTVVPWSAVGHVNNINKPSHKLINKHNVPLSDEQDQVSPVMKVWTGLRVHRVMLGAFYPFL